MMPGRSRDRAAFFALALVAAAFGCATVNNEEAQQVRTIAERHLDCPSGNFSIYVDDADMSTRSWTVRCEYHAIRVSCTTRSGCSDDVERLRMQCTGSRELMSGELPAPSR